MQMLSLKSVQSKIKSIISEYENQKYLLAVSGGADSMTLAHIFKDLHLNFEIAHINYKLRGEDSELDKSVVENFCKNFNINFNLYEISSKDQKPKSSIQVWARELRYKYFQTLQKKKNIDFIVTAHHLNDQLETFIINLSKASGLKGLSGIPIKENKILRPFLDFTKEEIYAYAEENNIEFREDLSNQKNDYLRNRIRNEITPKLLETNENFLENFRKSLDFLHQSKNFIVEKIVETEEKLTIFNPEHKILSKKKLAQESEFVQFEILKKYGFNKLEEIAKIFTAENGSYFLSSHFQLIINRNELILNEIKNNPKSADDIILVKSFDYIKNVSQINLAKIIGTAEFEKTFLWEFDVEKLTLPLKLCKKKEGDYFYPLGMNGKKKVSKFLRDEKLSILAREKTWILKDGNHNVLGVVPFRQDKRYISTEKTQKVLRIV
jgi:tRNA(Ile)-lysidine synthase